jgi:hypothetical protein
MIPIFVEKSYLEEKIERITESGCWIWLKGLGGSGYGAISRNGVSVGAHRVSYETYKGSIGDRHVCHTCDTPLCINPSHLFLGTNLDNILDAVKKGRKKTPRNRPSGLTYKCDPLKKAARREKYRKHSQELTDKAIADHRAGFGSIRGIAKKYGFTYTYFWRLLRR